MHASASLIAIICAQFCLGAAITPRDLVHHSTRSDTSTGQDPAQDFQPCGANETVLTCAENIAKTWQIPTSAQGEPQPMNIPVNLGSYYQGYIQPLVYIEASDCSLSEPQFVWQGQPMYCGISMCQDTFTFTTSSTVTTTLGFTASLTLTEAIEENALFAKFTTTVSATLGTSWSKSTAITTTNTTTQMFSMGNGQQCTPTTLQYNVQCKTKLRLADNTTEWPWTITSHAFLLPPTIKKSWSCNDAVTMSSENVLNEEFVQFCQALTSDGQLTTMDIGLPGYNAGSWSLQGCMWQT